MVVILEGLILLIMLSISFNPHFHRTIITQVPRPHECDSHWLYDDTVLPANLDIGAANLSLDLLAQNVLERYSISSEFRDALAQLLNGHLVLVEVEAEVGLVVDVALLLEVERAGILGDELLRDVIVGVVELLEEVGL